MACRAPYTGVRQLPFVVVGGEDSRGDVWATQLVGEAGFVRSRGDQQIIISGGILPDDPLAGSRHNVRSVVPRRVRSSDCMTGTSGSFGADAWFDDVTAAGAVRVNRRVSWTRATDAVHAA